jgi:hypothetical protein
MIFLLQFVAAVLVADVFDGFLEFNYKSHFAFKLIRIQASNIFEIYRMKLFTRFLKIHDLNNSKRTLS